MGNKNELQERLQLATLETDAVLDPNISELLDEDVLNVSGQSFVFFSSGYQ